MVSPSENTFSVLFVCTGNICRSPLGEFLFQKEMSPLSQDIAVSSAGTMAVVGGNIPAEILDIAAQYGAPIQNHRPRQITNDVIRGADLVLTAERSHRAEVVGSMPRASVSTFTLKQFARLFSAHETAIDNGEITRPEVRNLKELVAEIADFRSLAPPPEAPEDDDIEDPYRQSLTKYIAAGETISDSVSVIAKNFRKYAQR